MLFGISIETTYLRTGRPSDLFRACIARPHKPHVHSTTLLGHQACDVSGGGGRAGVINGFFWYAILHQKPCIYTRFYSSKAIAYFVDTARVRQAIFIAAARAFMPRKVSRPVGTICERGSRNPCAPLSRSSTANEYLMPSDPYV